MPKGKKPVTRKIKELVAEFPDDSLSLVYDTESSILPSIFCRSCGVRLGKDTDEMKRWAVVQHIRTVKHIKNKELFSKQQSLTFEKDSFFGDICQAFVAADIPLHKLNNVVLRECLEKYTGRRLPEESTVRKNYVNESYETTMECIRKEIGDAPVWVSIDETTDANGRFIANVIVGKLSSAEAGRPLLLNVAQLEKTNHQTIAGLLNTSMGLLWPDGVQHSKVLLFVTDAAPYMVKAGTALKTFYPNMMHVTCLAHGLHRVAEAIRGKYKLVDKFIASMKKIFLKAPDRVTAFHEKYPELKLPPKPVLTRWGTWLVTVSYYSENLNKIVEFVNTLDEDDAAAIKEVQRLLLKKERKLKMDILEIQQHYGGIAETITKLETKSLPLAEAAELWENTFLFLSSAPHEVIANKTISVANKNPDLNKLLQLAKMDESVLSLTPFKDMTPAELLNYRYAPLVSCDVERSFSTLKSMLRDNRRSFLVDNLKQHLIIASFFLV